MGAAKWDAIVVYHEVFPYLPAVFERGFSWLGVPYILDFDDAIFHQYDSHPRRLVRILFGRKIGRIIASAAAVSAGSEYLAQYARSFNTRVHIIPTVVDPARYVPAQPENHSPFSVGWIGSPSTASFLLDVADVLREMSASVPVKLIAVGARKLEIHGVETEIRPWRLQNESADLAGFDVGIMPLPDTPWARGKCGFKLIQYMAAALPTVASPVGANRDIVLPGVTGYLPSSPAEWVDALTQLANDASLKSKLGKAGRRRVISHYSMEAVGPRVEHILRQATRT